MRRELHGSGPVHDAPTAAGRVRPGRVLAALSAAMTSCVLPSFLLGAMAVQVRRDLGFASWGIGLAFAVFFAAGALASAPAGRLVDRSNPVWALRGAVIVSAAASLAIGGLAHSLAAVVVLIAVAGAANAACQPAVNVLLMRALPAHRHGVGFAIIKSAIPGAALLAGVAVPALALTVGWRWAFVVAALLSLATAACVTGQAGTGRKARLASGGAQSGTVPTQKRGGQPGVPLSTMVVLSVAVGLAATAASSLTSFLVSGAVDSGVAEGTAGLVLTGSSIAGIIVRLLIGARADRRNGGHFKVVALLMAGGALAFAGLAVGVPVVYLLAGPAAFCTAWAWQGLLFMAVVKANPSRPAAATGIIQTGTFLAGVIGPLLFGVVADLAGYQLAWLVASGLSALGSAALAAYIFRARRSAAS